MNDFTGTPFVAGSLIGLRAFKPGTGYTTSFSHDNHLLVNSILSPSQGFHWTSGENHAQCDFANYGYRLGHKIAQLDCSCGFYAYHDGSNTYMNTERFAGIVEGYGRCTIGSMGFRASKMRILAIAPGSAWLEKAPTSRLSLTRRRNYEALLPNLRKRYPEIKFFESEDKMLKNYTLSDVSGILDQAREERNEKEKKRLRAIVRARKERA